MAPPPLKILLVGSGKAGLSTAISFSHQNAGHDITVLERHPSTQALGGPVGLSANATRVLIHYGLEERMNAISQKDERKIFRRRYKDGSVLASMEAGKGREVFGYPSWVFSRYKLQETLAEAATDMGVKIQFGVIVIGVDQENPAVKFKDGTEMEADLIIGADGIRSIIRDEVLGQRKTSASPFSAYNIDIPRSLIQSNPSLAIS